ncbi:TPA: hypothetical protein MIU67_24280 [Klebsiella pneumoniae]|nr:hypothetical protein [Klebsiella pneumoniae]HBY4490737.1 hypothetical protein [Klebsiella pneumoniae]
MPWVFLSSHGCCERVAGVVSENGIYGHSRFCNTDFDDKLACLNRHCCKVSDEAAFCLIQRPYISKTLLTRRISPRGSP